MNLPPSLSQLVSDATEAGYSVAHDGSTLTIVRREGRHRKPRGLVYYECGTAFDVTVPLSAARGLRSYRSMRAVLGI